MRKFILSLIGLLFIGCVSMSNLKPIDTNKQFQKTIENIDLSKSEIFKKTLQWLAKSYNDSKEVIEFKDESSGKIIGRGSGSVVFNLTAIAPIIVNIRYTLTIEIKDNRARMTFSNFTSTDIGGGIPMMDNYLKLEPKLIAAVDDYKKYLNTKDEDW